jgi:CspA family cold shock protein
VKFFDAERGYGFVSRDGDTDLFVHATNLVGAPSALLEVGQSVTFEVGRGRRGAEAHNVRVVSGTPRGNRRPNHR